MYPCPCCGYKTLSEKPPGTYLICPICCWEDATIDNEPGSNGISLNMAQQNFIAFGACDSEWLSFVRAPTNAEERDSNWQTLEEKASTVKLRLIEQINQAFEGVTRGKGVSLHETRAIDNYEGEEGRAEARKKDTDTQWQDVPDEWITEFYDAFNYLDAKGFRYYIPAYMIWTLKNYKTMDSDAAYRTVKALRIWRPFNSRYDSSNRFHLLNQAQKEAVCNFLKFMVMYAADWVDSHAAKKALNQYWDCENSDSILS